MLPNALIVDVRDVVAQLMHNGLAVIYSPTKSIIRVEKKGGTELRMLSRVAEKVSTEMFRKIEARIAAIISFEIFQ